MRDSSLIKQNITPVKAREILKNNGLEVSLEEARLVLDFLYKMAKLEVKQALKQ